jgi:hypothetical protein
LSLSLLCLPAFAADDLPRRKSGLWHITMSGPHLGRMELEECVERSSDDMFKPEDPSSCSKIDVRRQGAAFNVELVCKEEDSTVTSRGSITGSFESAYKGNFNVTYSPPLEGMRETTMQTEARWVGPCKPGQKPGDINPIKADKPKAR